ncbi:hypothetical protein V1511DRAFT_496191 [Dipodascopsis uninucleata]
MSTIVLPGDPVAIPEVGDGNEQNRPIIQIGPGILHILPEDLIPVRAGSLETVTSKRRHARVAGKTTSVATIYVESARGRYVPAIHDSIIGTVLGRFGDLEKAYYRISLPSCTAPIGILSASAFANAGSRKTRPNLVPGTTVYARISAMSIALGEPELECFDERTGKDGGFGELKGGMIADVSVGMARRLLISSNSSSRGSSVVDVIGRSIPFEIVIGRNGRIWVDAGSCQATVAVLRSIQETSDMTTRDMERKVANILKSIQKV